MLADLFRAEWKKITLNRKALSFLVWVYPVAALTIAGLLLLTLLSPQMRTSLEESGAVWTSEFVLPWRTFTAFPGNVITRLPFLAFAALLFAGEYQWQTWKNIVPRSRRPALILVKFAALVVLLLLALGLTSVIWGAGRGLAAALAGAPYGPRPTIALLREFAGDYLLEVLLAALSTLILTGYAAVVATRARSILAGIFISLGVAIVEPVSLILLLLLANIVERPNLVRLYRLTPSYNLDNVRSWLVQGQAGNLLPANTLFGPVAALSDPLIFSLSMLILWLGALVGLTVIIFQRQDLT